MHNHGELDQMTTTVVPHHLDGAVNLLLPKFIAPLEATY